MIEISRTQDEEVGDGTTSVIILGEGLLSLLCIDICMWYYYVFKCNLCWDFNEIFLAILHTTLAEALDVSHKYYCMNKPVFYRLF